MLNSLLPYLAGAGIEARWAALRGDDDFFAVTKRLHNMLHGSEGDGGALGERESEIYSSTLAEDGKELLPDVRDGDIVFVHDPQTAGLIPGLVDRGASVVWHCHIGADEPNDQVRSAWNFLLDDVAKADRYIFSRSEYLWEGLGEDRLRVIAPSIDAFSPKNQPIDRQTRDAMLHACGVIDGNATGSPGFERIDGSRGAIRRKVKVVDDAGPIPQDVPILLQTSRWDRLKDPIGVIRLFAETVAPADDDVHLVLAGPSVDGVSDDPEGDEILHECRALRRSLPRGTRDRVRLVCSPMEDEDEAAAIVNALQRRADVVVQKSLAEGFGLVVSEAMWKERPVVSGRVGGIQDQIEHHHSGVLIDDPSDDGAFGEAVLGLLADRGRARAMGAAAHDRVLERFLTPRQLTETMDVVCELS